MRQESDDFGTFDNPADTNATYITQEELLRRVGDQRCDVTGRKIDRWRSEDCLPRTRHVYTIGVRGSSSYYPAHAVQQALAICQLQAAKRYSFDELRVLLWIDGHRIPPERVQASLQHLIEHVRDEFYRRGLANWRDTLAVAERLTTQVLPSLARSAFGRLIKRRLAPSDWASYLTMQMQLLVGGAPAFSSGDEYVTENGEALDKPLAQLVIDAYALHRAQTDILGDAKPWLPMNIAPTLIDLARRRIFSLQYALTTIERATPEQLAQALVDRQVMFVDLPKLARGVESFFGTNAFGFGMFGALAHWMPKDDAIGQALLVVSLLVVRRSGYDHALDQVSAAIHEAATAYSRWQTLLVALERELPEYAAAIAPDPKLVNSHLNHTAYMQGRLSQIQEIAERHRDELHAFRERHPELSGTVS